VTAVVVVASKCRFCLASAPFYRDLVALESAKQGRFRARFVSILDIEDAKAFAQKANLPESSIVETS
jgi:hypothetical protein